MQRSLLSRYNSFSHCNKKFPILWGRNNSFQNLVRKLDNKIVQPSLVSLYNKPFNVFHRSFCTSESDLTLDFQIGSNVHVSIDIIPPKNPSLVPYFEDSLTNDLLSSPEYLSHLAWMAQKDKLGQDIMLIGSPGPLKRWIALKYCEMTHREVEYLALSRDTAESDLKQRRELGANKTTLWIDQCAVRAAIEGRILILEGIEKAERNILPLLNNLLENREMMLEDGRFLMSPQRYDQLINDKLYTKEQLDQLKVVRVHPRFRVIALGLPVPRFPGNSLDPPLRSRFQGRHVQSPSSEVLFALARKYMPNVDQEIVKNIISFAETLRSMETQNYKDLVNLPPEFPASTGVFSFLKLINELFPALQVNNAIQLEPVLNRVYPFPYLGKDKNSKATEVVIKLAKERFLHPISPTSEAFPLKTDYLHYKSKFNHVSTSYISTPATFDLLCRMLQDHLIQRDICLLGPKGSGKSTLIRHFAVSLGYSIETMTLYKDMSTRDLLQRRVTLEDGSTAWEPSALVVAALEGRIAVLDNIDRLPVGTLSVLQRLIHDREITLFDGTQLVSAARYQKLVNSGVSVENVRPVHPEFRIIATGQFPTSDHKYITEELMHMFLFHSMPSLTEEDILSFLIKYKTFPPFFYEYRKVGTSSPEWEKSVRALLHFSQLLNVQREERRDIPLELSVRQLIRIASRLVQYPNDLYHCIQETFLTRLLPATTRDMLDKLLSLAGITASPASTSSKPEFPTKSVDSQIIEHLIPKVLFYEIPTHQLILNEMLLDFNLKDHILLIGSQGTGKNKLTDKFLEKLQLPRQYIQLHRDTTVQSLTGQPTLLGGKITSQDSPLVTAVTKGHVLVIDEADKAPLEVVTMLRHLVDGEMTLPDGRRILSQDLLPLYSHSKGVIPIHPGFRMIVLANRPGWPFLGNDFFRECGDLFSTHAIENPEPESEVKLLRSYAPNLPDSLLQNLAKSFHELRTLVDNGLLSYPYSTREALGIVKHLQAFPNDSFENALENVFSFDVYDPQVREHIQNVFKNHGFEIRTQSRNVVMDTIVEYKRKEPKVVGGPKHGKIDPKNCPHVGGNQWAGGTGGSMTAGLGGGGGPYRLASGHPIHQIPADIKASLNKQVGEAAKAMAKEALKQRLKEIDMSIEDASKYEIYLNSVRTEINQLRVILQGLQAKSLERVWLKNQTSGDLDDSKLIEGMTGEKTIYKRRGETKDSMGQNQQKKKLMRFVMDCSGSMYYFNHSDGRLDRLLETAVMIMESFHGYENKFAYEMTGHSGNGPDIPLIDMEDPPKDRKERFKVLNKIVAHSQFCFSGDYTLEATKDAVKEMAKMENADERFVFVISDANLQRYGISPEHLGQVLVSEKNVQAYIIFIASLHQQAVRLRAGVPPGHAFICQETSELPITFKQIFTSHVVK